MGGIPHSFSIRFQIRGVRGNVRDKWSQKTAYSPHLPTLCWLNQSSKVNQTKYLSLSKMFKDSFNIFPQENRWKIQNIFSPFIASRYPNISKMFSWMLYGHPKWFIFSYYYSVDKKNVYKSVLARLRISIIWTGTKNKCDCQWSLSLLNGQEPFPFPENTGNTI